MFEINLVGGERVMKKSVYLMLLVVLLGVNLSEGGVSIVMNGSFESDGLTSSQDITVLPPKGWTDVDIPQDGFGNYTQFGGFVGKPWSQEGDYSLTFFSKSNGKYQAGDYAALSQQVWLGDVSKLGFTVQLTTEYPDYVDWSNHEFCAFVALDDVMVWNSDNIEIAGTETYVVEVNDIGVQDGNKHKLTVAMVSNKTITLPYYISYIARFDFLHFDTHCGGFGYLPGDLDNDCYVDFADYALLADKWLGDANELGGYGMPDEGIVDEYSLVVIAEDWLACTNSNDANCVCVPLFFEDVTGDGVVDGLDMAALCEQWLLEEPNELSCDFNYDGLVDAADYAAIANKWQQKNWIYGLE